jgi:hypothetical protein
MIKDQLFCKDCKKPIDPPSGTYRCEKDQRELRKMEEKKEAALISVKDGSQLWNTLDGCFVVLPGFENTVVTESEAKKIHGISFITNVDGSVDPIQDTQSQ